MCDCLDKGVSQRYSQDANRSKVVAELGRYSSVISFSWLVSKNGILAKWDMSVCIRLLVDTSHPASMELNNDNW